MRRVDGPHLPSQVIFIAEKAAVATISSAAAVGIGFLIFTGIAWMVYWSSPLMAGNNAPTVTTQAPSTQPDSEVIQLASEEINEPILSPSIPTQLQIPTLNIDSKVQLVGKTKKGAMDVPTKTDEVGWFDPGFKPGENGNSVITGHFDTFWMRPAIFARIHELKETDEVVVTDESSQKWVFVVKKVEVYPVKEVPISELFGNSESAKLNLITCSGRWSWKVGSYSERTIVRTELLRVDRI